MSDRMTDERLAEIDASLKKPWCIPSITLTDKGPEIFAALKAERQRVLELGRELGDCLMARIDMHDNLKATEAQASAYVVEVPKVVPLEVLK